MDLLGKDFIVSQEWSLAELKELLDLAANHAVAELGGGG